MRGAGRAEPFTRRGSGKPNVGSIPTTAHYVQVEACTGQAHNLIVNRTCGGDTSRDSRRPARSGDACSHALCAIGHQGFESPPGLCIGRPVGVFFLPRRETVALSCLPPSVYPVARRTADYIRCGAMLSGQSAAEPTSPQRGGRRLGHDLPA